MAGLGRVEEIWHWPYHKYIAVRHEYLKIVGPAPEPEPDGDNVMEIAPGVFRTITPKGDPKARVTGD